MCFLATIFSSFLAILSSSSSRPMLAHDALPADQGRRGSSRASGAGGAEEEEEEEGVQPARDANTRGTHVWRGRGPPLRPPACEAGEGWRALNIDFKDLSGQRLPGRPVGPPEPDEAAREDSPLRPLRAWGGGADGRFGEGGSLASREAVVRGHKGLSRGEGRPCARELRPPGFCTVTVQSVRTQLRACAQVEATWCAQTKSPPGPVVLAHILSARESRPRFRLFCKGESLHF